MLTPMDTRREYSLSRLGELEHALDGLGPLLDGAGLCVYATGSYGRLEAWSGSDIDLFFLHDERSGAAELPSTTFIRVAASLIEKTEQMGFPPFSQDGRYLEVLRLADMEEHLGSPTDDSINAFTARMLLLLESRPVRDSELYESLLERVIALYFRDFDDHPDDFDPVFLVNDVLRFWRTLTLNYEHHRLKVRRAEGEVLRRKKADNALKNYKLKVSRMATCFSMVASLASAPVPVTAEAVKALCLLTPRERFAALRERGRGADVVRQMEDVYDRFLASTQCADDELVERFASEGESGAAVEQAREYGDLIYSLLQDIVPSARFRYLVL